MGNVKEKSNKITAAVIGIAAAVIMLALYGVSRAWLSENREVQRGNVSMALSTTSASGIYKESDTEYGLLDGKNTSFGSYDGKTFTYPGSEVEFYVGLINRTDTAASVKSVGFEVPEVGGTSDDDGDFDELPVKTGEYFGTQLEAYVDGYTVYHGASVDDGGEFTYTSSEEIAIASPVSYKLLEDDNTASEILLASDLDIDLSNKTAVLFHIVVKFVNDTDGDRNEFINFGSDETGGKFSRSICFGME